MVGKMKVSLLKQLILIINCIKMSNKTPYVVTILSIFLNILLGILKFIAGYLSKSVALTADAWHTLSDSISSFAVLLGLKIASQPADKTHPYGHGRAELIASIIVGVLLAVIGCSFLFESIIELKNHVTVEYTNFAIWITALSVIIKEIMAIYSIKVGKKYKYNSLRSDGWHHRSDAISSAIILVGILLGHKFWWIDSVLGIMVSFMIFYTTYSILKDDISPLIGEGIDDKLKDDIIKCGWDISSDLDLQAHNFKIHRYGHHSELSFHIRLPGDYTLSKAHEIANRYEKRIETSLNCSISVTIHVDDNG